MSSQCLSFGSGGSTCCKELPACLLLLQFFYSRVAPYSTRSTSTACIVVMVLHLSMGYFISSVLVTTINSTSGNFGRPQLGGNDLNHTQLDLFYTIILCILNFLKSFELHLLGQEVLLLATSKLQLGQQFLFHFFPRLECRKEQYWINTTLVFFIFNDVC